MSLWPSPQSRGNQTRSQIDAHPVLWPAGLSVCGAWPELRAPSPKAKVAGWVLRMPATCVLDLGDRDLAVHAIGFELDLGGMSIDGTDKRSVIRRPGVGGLQLRLTRPTPTRTRYLPFSP